MALLDKFEGVDANELVDFLIDRKRFLPKDVKDRIKASFGSDDDEGGVDFDLHKEVVDQLNAVKHLRKAAMNSDGTLVAGIREAKETLSATTSLLTLLTKLQGDIYNSDRVRTIQKITIETLKEVDPTLQEKFILLLEERLGVKR